MSYDWRMNPYKCLACETRLQDCRCCDTGAPTLPFVVVIEGCGTFQGRYEFDATRYRDPDTLPAGVTYPATDPCGVFWGTLSAGEGCTAGGSTWSGSLGLLSWCDGTNAAIPWHVEVFCFDTYLSAWVSQGEATVTSYECRCDGPRFAFTLPTLDCCCDGTTVPTCCCPDDEIPDTITADITSSCSEVPSQTIVLTYDSGLDSWVAASVSAPFTAAEVYCEAGSCEWKIGYTIDLSGTCSYGPAAELLTASSPSCNPFSLSFTGFLPSPCCGGGSGTFSVSVTA